MDRVRVLLVPGLWNSGPESWQAYWQRERQDCERLQQADWEKPKREVWVATLERAVDAARGPLVLAAHSLGCATVVHWAAAASTESRAQVRGALLVAPSDVEAPLYPRGTEGFTPMPLARLPFPSILVASTNDRYVTLERATLFARAWASRLVDVGPKGHINADSRLGAWTEGQRLLDSLLTA